MIKISSYSEYDYLINNGYQPLINWRMFQIEFELRVKIQADLFGVADFKKSNEKFYRWCWDHNLHYCEEYSTPLDNYSAVFISHIITKGSDRRMAIDPRNVNILSFKAHNQWEFGTLNQKKGMNIWSMNQLIIDLLKKDYNFV